MIENLTTFYKRITRKKNLDIVSTSSEGLKRTLGAFDLIVLGVGAVIGSGIFTLSGVAIAGEAAAGPSFMISLIFAGLACVFAAFSYAEFSSMIPAAGSAYTYTFVTFGELAAWLIGWILMLEYAIGNITVAVAWSEYWFQLLKGFEGILPEWLINQSYWVYDFTFGSMPIYINIPAILLTFFITYMLFKGISESAKTAALMVIIKLAVILGFIVVGAFYVKPENWSPFMPGGFNGIFEGAFLIFFAYIGFDAVSTAAEETKNPQKNVPIGIIGSLFVCTLIYLAFAAVLTGMFPSADIIGNKEFIGAPIAYAMRAVDQNWLAGLISLGAVAGLFSVLLVLQLGTTRILFAMSRDKFLPSVFAKVHKKLQTPHIITWAAGVFVVLGTFVLNLEEAAHLCNIGTFASFIIVSLGVIVLRYTDPKRERPFRIPLMPLIPLMGIIFCLYIIYRGIPFETLISFSVWVLVGIIIYFCYGFRKTKEDFLLETQPENELELEKI